MIAKPKTIDEYLASLDDDKRIALEKLRKIIKGVAPKAEECISYQMPAFRHDGRMLVWFGAGANHCAFYPGGIVEQYKGKLKEYKTSKGTIQFQPDKPIPTTLVQKIVKAKIAENKRRISKKNLTVAAEMRKLILAINVSLDGFADHTVAIADDELHDFFSRLLDETDIALFGRATYQLMENYWPNARQDPNATKSMLDFADKFNAIPKIVFSRTLEKAGWNNTTLVKENMVEEVTRLKQQSGRNISLGGISVSQEFMRRGLIDEYWLAVQPVIWRNGKRLFDGLNDKINLKLIDTRTFKSGVVVLHYLHEGK